LKGLIISNLDRKSEAVELVKKGLKLDIRSAVSWHIYGLLQRGDKNYEEAIKCYSQSLKIDNVFKY
jgi:tetratricopeptide (TPR) repeat protein